MSDVKEVGIIGQKYEDRTTGKIGTLESRDDKCKTLMMIDSEGKGFSISYSSFRSKWRKVQDVGEVVDTAESSNAAESSNISEDSKHADADGIYYKVTFEDGTVQYV